MIKTHFTHSGTTVGDRLTANIPIVSHTASLSDAQALFLKRSGKFDTAKYVHVVDDAGYFIGIFHSREIFRHPPHTLVTSLLEEEGRICIVKVADDQEIAVKQALLKEVESVVVVDDTNKLVGAISIKELLKILLEETQEDLAALGHFDMSPRLDSILDIPLIESIKNRTPWIIIGLLGGIGVAAIISQFDELLTHNIILASYIPLAVYITGAVSAQLQINYIRDLAFYPTLPLGRYVWRQGAVVVVLATLITLALLIIGIGIRDLGSVGILIAGGIGLAVLSAVVTGIGVPTLLAKIVKDPANATAPIATIISDTLTIVVFFGIASIWLV